MSTLNTLKLKLNYIQRSGRVQVLGFRACALAPGAGSVGGLRLATAPPCNGHTQDPS